MGEVPLQGPGLAAETAQEQRQAAAHQVAGRNHAVGLEGMDAEGDGEVGRTPHDCDDQIGEPSLHPGLQEDHYRPAFRLRAHGTARFDGPEKPALGDIPQVPAPPGPIRVRGGLVSAAGWPIILGAGLLGAGAASLPAAFLLRAGIRRAREAAEDRIRRARETQIEERAQVEDTLAPHADPLPAPAGRHGGGRPRPERRGGAAGQPGHHLRLLGMARGPRLPGPGGGREPAPAPGHRHLAPRKPPRLRVLPPERRAEAPRPGPRTPGAGLVQPPGRLGPLHRGPEFRRLLPAGAGCGPDHGLRHPGLQERGTAGGAGVLLASRAGPRRDHARRPERRGRTAEPDGRAPPGPGGAWEAEPPSGGTERGEEPVPRHRLPRPEEPPQRHRAHRGAAGVGHPSRRRRRRRWAAGSPARPSAPRN